MKRLQLLTYRYREHLGEADLRDLTKKFLEVGTAPGVIGHYTRLDGQGGFLIQELADDPAKDFEVMIQYGPWMTFELFPVATIEETFPIVQKLYG